MERILVKCHTFFQAFMGLVIGYILAYVFLYIVKLIEKHIIKDGVKKNKLNLFFIKNLDWQHRYSDELLS